MINSRSINRTIKKSVMFLALQENAICYLRTTRLIVKFWTTFLAKKICVTVCSDFRWSIRSRQVITKANRLLGLLRRSAVKVSNTNAHRCLYLSLVRSNLADDSQVWNPQSVKLWLHLEIIQRRATKFILLLPFRTSDKSRLLTLKLLPLCYWYD